MLFNRYEIRYVPVHHFAVFGIFDGCESWREERLSPLFDKQEYAKEWFDKWKDKLNPVILKP